MKKNFLNKWVSDRETNRQLAWTWIWALTVVGLAAMATI